MVSESRARERAAAAGSREHLRRHGEGKAVPPCVSCGTLGGGYHKDGVSPSRTSGARFGIDGLLCKSCISKHYHRAARPTSVPPCSRCGDPAGYVRPGARLPVRYDGTRFGWPGGKVCHGCIVTDPSAKAAAFGGYVPEPWAPSAEEVARETTRILEEIAERGRAMEARRVVEALAASRWAPPAVGAAMAIEQFKRSSFGPMAFPGRGERGGVRA